MGHSLIDRCGGRGLSPPLPAPSPERSAWRQQVQCALRNAPGCQAASLSGLGALALRRADSHWLSSFTFFRELVGGGQRWGLTQGAPSAPPSYSQRLTLHWR